MLIYAEDNYLANKVKRIGTVAEATIASCKVIQLRKFSNSSIVSVRIIKYKVTKAAYIDAKNFKRLINNLSNPLASIGAYKL